MDKQALTQELQVIISEYLKTQGLELVDLTLRRQGMDLFLQVLTDRPEGGIALDDCAYLNKEISRILDEKKILLQDNYVLEVSSPGLDRPLKTKVDFLRCLNRRVRFFLAQPIGGKLEICGNVKGITGESVYVELNGESIEVPLSAINKAKQEI